MIGIPENNQKYPAQVLREDGGSGSGFFLSLKDKIFFVTAKHVFVNPLSSKLFCDRAEIWSYSTDSGFADRVKSKLELNVLMNKGFFKKHPSKDVVVIKVGDGKTGQQIVPNEGWLFENVKQLTITCAQGNEAVSMYDDVLVSNDVYLFGYPTSLGLKKIPQLDYERPLLRKGIIAGKNDALKKIIVDVPVYPGNSGGPMVQIITSLEKDGRIKNIRGKVFGVAVEYVPYAKDFKNLQTGELLSMVENSGYSIVEPMDPVMELVESY